jgi:hypothetical protein
MPPCFARATLLRPRSEQPALLVGGTASIIGEESRHVDILDAQARETFRNLASLVASAVGRTLPEDTTATEIHSLLNRFQELRVYYTNPAHRERLAALVRTTFSSQCRVEWLQVLLCRAELLVEIEGVAYPETSGAAEAS